MRLRSIGSTNCRFKKRESFTKVKYGYRDYLDVDKLNNKLGILLLILLTIDIVDAQYADKGNIINRQIFLENVPKQMVVGESYTINIIVQNNGYTDDYFQVMIFFPNAFFYPTNAIKTFELKKGETHKFKFSFTPIKEHIGELSIKAVLFSVDKKKTPYELGYISINDTGEFFQAKELEEIESKVYSIKQKYSIEFIQFIAGILSLTVVFFWTIRRN